MTGIVLLVLRIILAVVIYSFLGWAMFLLWRLLRHEAITLASRKTTPLALLISSPDAEDQTFEVIQNDVAIGRDPDCECVLSHGTVSARHARLAYHHGQWWVDDLQSTNGTKLNDEPLQMPTVVVNGDKIKCGQIILTVIFKSETTAGTGELV
jgi:pSer/pThr/pTyr-binding forkhead associated (FHA) protein